MARRCRKISVSPNLNGQPGARKDGPIRSTIPDLVGRRYCMFKNTKILAVAFMGLGMLLGYAAAAGKLNPAMWARASQPVPTTAADQPVSVPDQQAGCCDGVNKGQLVALANHNERVAPAAQTSGQKPNILIIWGDDIGWFNPSCYHGGVMGYQTPNIDRIAREGARFTDWYGQQSCTAGRAAFIMGQSPIRTGLTKVGLPGSTLGLQP